MAELQRPSREAAERIALPILLEGYIKRGKQRSERELKLRTKEKVERDERHNQKPKLSTI